MLANFDRSGASHVNARLIFPGTLYNFGAPAPPKLLREDTPQQPSTRKGRIRVEMEAGRC